MNTVEGALLEIGTGLSLLGDIYMEDLNWDVAYGRYEGDRKGRQTNQQNSQIVICPIYK